MTYLILVLLIIVSQIIVGAKEENKVAPFNYFVAGLLAGLLLSMVLHARTS